MHYLNVFPQVATSTPTEEATQVPASGTVILTSSEAGILAFSLIIALLICISIVFIFGRRLHMAANLRDSLVEGKSQQICNEEKNKLREDAWAHPLDEKENAFPEDLRVDFRHYQIYADEREEDQWEQAYLNADDPNKSQVEKQKQFQERIYNSSDSENGHLKKNQYTQKKRMPLKRELIKKLKRRYHMLWTFHFWEVAGLSQPQI